jgi:adenine-specific DNA-methyltransferase
MSDSLAKFQQLLAELFQFDAADLDFGIYRIMNHKRQEVQRFIMEELPAAVAHELDRDALAAQAAQDLEPIFKARMFAPVEA